jgi:endonuclease YncB( thermonuclease family)
MPFHVIRGTFHVKGYSPDGDSIRFKADDEAHWDLLDGPPPKLNARRHAQLRLEAIDTLETHFESAHQPLELAQQATERLLNNIGITGVEWNAPMTTVTQANDNVPGYIVTREVEKNRRPVAFAFTGTPAEQDGSEIFLDVSRVLSSVNAESLRSGLAYPTYYRGLFPDLRNALTAEVASARAGGKGVWAEDVTNQGFDVPGLSSITDDHVILPKLFRRLATYLQNGGSVVGFKQELADLAEGIFIISTAHATHFDTIIEEVGSTIRMTEPPENVIFVG